MLLRTALAVPLAIALLTTGCGKRGDVEALDRELINGADNQTDPALSSALEDQIMVDPALAQQANRHSVRPADAPVQAPIPPGVDPAGDDAPADADRPTLGDLAQMQGRRTAQAADCYAELAYSHGWANRLPEGVPLFPDAAVSEAAGNDVPGCRTRVVSYASAAPVARLIRFYVAQSRRAGFASDYTRRNGDLVVAGDRARDGTAFYVTVTPRPSGGSDVDIVTNNGR